MDPTLVASGPDELRNRCGKPGALLLITIAFRIPGPHQRLSVVRPAAIFPRVTPIPLCPGSSLLKGWSPKRIGRSAENGIVCQGEEKALRPGGVVRIASGSAPRKLRFCECTSSGARMSHAGPNDARAPKRNRSLCPRPAHKEPWFREKGVALLTVS